MKNKNKVYVEVESKEQAEMFRTILDAMGENVSLYNIDWFNEGSQLGPNGNGGFWLSSNYHKSPVEYDEDQTIYQKITFGELIDLLQRKPLLISEDGVNLFEGDEYSAVDLELNSICHKGKLSKHFDYTKAGFKYFSSESKALEWIESQKPKYKTVKTYFGLEARIMDNSEIHIYKENDFYIKLSYGDIHDIKQFLTD